MIPKFRAWDKKRGMMKVFGLLQNCSIAQLYNDDYSSYMAFVDEIKLMQSTGLNDKNGVEIFEGDVVLVSMDNSFDHLDNKKTVVKKSEFHSGLICKSLASGMEYRVFKRNKAWYEYEVIGNIYENPELLEESK